MINMVNELRRDYFLDKHVIIAKERSKRPTDFAANTRGVGEGECFFCPGSEDKTPPEIMRKTGQGGWTIRVFPNKYPAVEPKKDKHASQGEGEFIQPAWGHHEIVVETPRHGESICDLGVGGMAEVLRVFVDRITALKQEKDVEYVSLFKNHGKSAGASLSHSHTQIITTPITPPLVEEKTRGQRLYAQD
ncbi:MAG: DUF4931 domain-containing protein, partial [Candidatus Altiarchaeales archaeon]|nr:DUF4931 domain-containing protein [Candidatus Altiarchaeales archaeon]